MTRTLRQGPKGGANTKLQNIHNYPIATIYHENRAKEFKYIHITTLERNISVGHSTKQAMYF